MKNLSKFEITMISAFAVVLVLGIGGWWYTGSLQQEASQRLRSANTKLMNLQVDRYMPGPAAIQVLNEKIELVDKTLEPIEKNVLEPDKDALASLQTMVPSVWKEQTLRTAVERMTSLSASKNIKLPETDQDLYYFGFDRYIGSTPQERDIVNLTAQLIGIEAAYSALAEAGGVREILAIRRSHNEDGRIDHSSGALNPSIGISSSGVSKANRLPFNIEEPYNGLYRVYPLEFEFKAEAKSVRGFLNNLAKSKLIFAVRSVGITTTSQQSPRFSEIKQKSDAMEKKNKQFVFGTEQVVAKVRFDLVDWLGVENMKDPDEMEDEPQPRQARR